MGTQRRAGLLLVKTPTTAKLNVKGGKGFSLSKLFKKEEDEWSVGKAPTTSVHLDLGSESSSPSKGEVILTPQTSPNAKP